MARLIREYTKKTVCCIGDGGNDVAMIQAADVGEFLVYAGEKGEVGLEVIVVGGDVKGEGDLQGQRRSGELKRFAASGLIVIVIVIMS